MGPNSIGMLAVVAAANMWPPLVGVPFLFTALLGPLMTSVVATVAAPSPLEPASPSVSAVRSVTLADTETSAPKSVLPNALTIVARRNTA